MLNSIVMKSNGKYNVWLNIFVYILLFQVQLLANSKISCVLVKYLAHKDWKWVAVYKVLQLSQQCFISNTYFFYFYLNTFKQIVQLQYNMY